MSLGCAAKGHGSPARILLVTPRPRLICRGSTYLAYASYNTPSFVCVKPKLLDGGMALVWSYASSVWCGAVRFFVLGMYGKRLYTLLFQPRSTRTDVVFYILFLFLSYYPLVYNVR